MHGTQGNGLSKPRLVLRRHGMAKLTGVMAAAALAVPAAAAGYAAPGDSATFTGQGPNPDTQAAATFTGPGPNPDTQGLVLHRDTQGTLVLHRDGSKAVPFVADTGASATTSSDGFDWGDAMIGAGAVLGIAALGAAGLTLRRRTAIGADSVAARS
jgi:hypothetical protein